MMGEPKLTERQHAKTPRLQTPRNRAPTIHHWPVNNEEVRRQTSFLAFLASASWRLGVRFFTSIIELEARPEFRARLRASVPW